MGNDLSLMIYQQKNISLNIFERIFKESVDSDELKWHKDQYDRKVFVKESNNWKLQMDDELPVVLERGKTYFIPKETYHRVIKGQDDLVIIIDESSDKVFENKKITIPDNVLSNMKRGYSLLKEEKYNHIRDIIESKSATILELKEMKKYFDSKRTNIIRENKVRKKSDLEHMIHGGNSGYLWLISLFG